MALSCCRILCRQSNLSLRHVFQNIPTRSRCEINQNISRSLRKEVRNSPPTPSHPLQINSRGFRGRKTDDVKSNQVFTTDSQGNSNSFSLLKSAAFVTGVCSCSFVGAMIWNYENVRKVYKDMAAEKDIYHGNAGRKVLGFRQHINAIWSGLDTSTKLTLGIIAANATVWVLWKVPRLQAGMVRYFSSSAAHPRSSMVLSSFSHISFLHLAVNMYVLLSFAPVAARLFGHEQFSAFYISAGTISAFTSILCQRLLRRPLIVSVGASGAIMGLLGVTGVVYPHAQLQIAFVSEIIPHSFSAETGIKAIILFDLLGLFLGWKVLDHAGHLGGMLFGILYAKYGKDMIWGKRDRIVKAWHDMRGKP